MDILFIMFLMVLIPYFWENGPENILHPDFWYFAGALFLIDVIFGWAKR